MKVKYDKENDIVVIIFSENAIVESEETKPGLVFDYSEDGSIVSIEVMNASKQMTFPFKVKYEVA
jgi:uncharacterized protein YuzE